MVQKQKEAVLALLKSDMVNKSYENSYWFPYNDFFDMTDDFTEFSCERGYGKQGYISFIENLLSTDETAKVFVEVYGFEEDENDKYIYAETLIIFSKLSLAEIESFFNEPTDIFPSEIGELTDFDKHNFVIDENGDLLPATNLSNSGHSVYYCWWD